MISRKGAEEMVQRLECTLFFQRTRVQFSTTALITVYTTTQGTRHLRLLRYLHYMHTPAHRDTHMHKMKIKNDETRQGRSEVVSTCSCTTSHRESQYVTKHDWWRGCLCLLPSWWPIQEVVGTLEGVSVGRDVTGRRPLLIFPGSVLSVRFPVSKVWSFYIHACYHGILHTKTSETVKGPWKEIHETE